MEISFDDVADPERLLSRFAAALAGERLRAGAGRDRQPAVRARPTAMSRASARATRATPGVRRANGRTATDGPPGGLSATD